MDISFYKSPVGFLKIVCEGGKLVSLQLVSKTEKTSDETVLIKLVKHQLEEYFSGERKTFDIEISLANAIEFHNNRELSSTGYKPVDIRDTKDKDIINKVVLNIIKSMQRKLDKFKYCIEKTLLLITKEIELKGSRYILKKK